MYDTPSASVSMLIVSQRNWKSEEHCAAAAWGRLYFH